MQLTQTRLALAGALLLSLALPCHAEDDDAPGVEIELKNDTRGKGSSMLIKARTRPLPDGTHLTISFAARGKSRDHVVSMMRVIVNDNKFEVKKAWGKRRIAPLLYVIKVELDLRKQSGAVQNWLMTEYGHSATHQETLDELKTSPGTTEEQATFALENLTKIEAMTVELQGMLEKVKALTAVPVADVPDWSERETAIYGEMGAFRNRIDKHFKAHVILLEQGLYKRLQRGLSKLSKVVRDFGRGDFDPESALAGLTRVFASNVEMVRKLKPTQLEKPLIPDDDLDEEGGD